jgi:hypothetical protein
MLAAAHILFYEANRLWSNLVDTNNGPPQWCAEECEALEMALDRYGSFFKTAHTEKDNPPGGDK